MTTTPAVDDFAYIRARLAELEGEPKEAEQPKAWPDFTPVDTAYSPEVVTETIWGHYSAPDQDCAWRDYQDALVTAILNSSVVCSYILPDSDPA